MATDSEAHSRFLVKLTRFCMMIRSKLGIKIEAMRMVDEPAYAADIFQQIQNHEGVNEEILTACLDVSAELSPASGQPKRASSGAGSDAKKGDPSIKKDLKFGPRG